MITVNNYSIDKRKNDGIFYTPSFLADYLAKKVLHYLGDNKAFSIIDPACGDSILLRSFIKELSNLQVPFPKVIGIDKDRNAINNSKAKVKDMNIKSLQTQFIHTDALFPSNTENPEQGWKKIKEVAKCKSGFTIALSNPPWGSDLNGYTSSKLSSNFILAKGQFDIFDLFYETIANNMEANGIFGLILPDSVFSQEQAKFRELLAKNSTIFLIARLGEKIFPEINRACSIIIAQNSLPENHHLVDCFRLSSDYKKQVIANEKSLEEVERELSHKVLQKRFLENKNFGFDIDLKIEEQNLYNKIQTKSSPLNKYIKSTRGAEISKKGIVCLCPNCKIWMPFPRATKPVCNNCHIEFDPEKVITDKIITSIKTSDNFIFKSGEDLFRFTSRAKSYIDLSKNGINYKNTDIYQNTKILVRKTGIGVTASIDYDHAITNQVVYILNVKPEFENKLSLEFVLAVLNSRVSTYYLIKKYGENEWRTHPYLTQTALMNLPIPSLDFDDITTVSAIKKITHIVRTDVKSSNEKNISRTNDIIIERMIADLFHLSELDYETIFETLKNSEQLIPIKRLLNCNPKEIFSLHGI